MLFGVAIEGQTAPVKIKGTPLAGSTPPRLRPDLVGANSVARIEEPEETYSTMPRSLLPLPPAAARRASAAASASAEELPPPLKWRGPEAEAATASAAATAVPSAFARAKIPLPAASAAADAATSSSWWAA